MAQEATVAFGDHTGAPERADIWPHTTRLLPWMLAGFLAMLFLVPITAVQLQVPSPVDPDIDRYALGFVVIIWILVALLGRRLPVRVERPQLFLWATVAFVSIALISIVMNLADIASHNLFHLAGNRLALLFSFAVFGCFTVAAMRPAELANFSLLFIVLASVTAVGILWERRYGYNVFYTFVGHIFHPIASVAPSPTNIHPDPTLEDRRTIVGPTEHGLAATTMLIMAFPFAIVRFTQARGDRRYLYALAAALILAAALSTERKTAVIAPIAALLVVFAYRPRAVLRMAPLGLVMLAFIHVIAPGALGTAYKLEDVFGSNSDTSSLGRSDDYTAISPEFLARPLLGWGYGTRDIDQADSVRILDNEYLDELLTVGLIGTLAFIAMIVSPLVVAHRPIRSGDPARAGPALAASAGCAAFLVISFLFDSMSFPQAPYMFFFVAAVATVAASRELPAQVRVPAGPSARRSRQLQLEAP